jgi:ferredoxin
MKPEVDWELCESNGVCMGVMPSVFELRDDDKLYLLREDLEESERPTLQQAVRQCPRQAISIST